MTVERLNREQINQLLAATSAKTLDDLLTHISMRDFDAAVVARTLLPAPVHTPKPVYTPSANRTPATLSTVIIAGLPGLHYKLGKCCLPHTDSPIIGYLTLSRGVTVHTRECANIKTADERRLLDAHWA
jgi:(p)ppGpp synthase/HD superfamily hydrolase